MKNRKARFDLADTLSRCNSGIKLRSSYVNEPACSKCKQYRHGPFNVIIKIEPRIVLTTAVSPDIKFQKSAFALLNPP